MKLTSALLLLTTALVHSMDDNPTNTTVFTRNNLRGGYGYRRSNQNMLMKRMIVNYKQGQRDSCRISMMKVASSLNVEHSFDALDSFVVTAAPDEIDSLESIDNIVSMEEDAIRYPMTVFSESDMQASAVIDELVDDLPYGIGLVQAPQVWQQGFRGQGVTVCVIDSGVDQTHEDLDQLSGYIPRQDGLQWFLDSSGHGTHVAGTIAARDNDVGVVGVAPESSLHIIRVFADNGGFAFTSGLVNAALQCVEAGAKVISMSLGGPFGSNFENRAFDTIVSRGVLPVAAAGNDGNTAFAFPASYDSVLSVAAVDRNKRLGFFSQRNRAVDIAAPGVSVRSTLPRGRYGSLSGTSMATPHVSGVAALLWSADPRASVDEIRQAILSTAEDLGSRGRDDSFGAGLVQASRALQALTDGGRVDDEDESDGVATTPPVVDDGDSPTCEAGSALFRLVLQTDDKGQETLWQLRRQSDGAGLVESNLESNSRIVREGCLSTNDCYQFTILDRSGDGLGQGSYSVSFGDETVKTGRSFGRAEQVTFGSSCTRAREEPVSSRCTQGQVPVDFFLRTDSKGEETSVRLVDQDGTILREHTSGLLDNQAYVLTECVAPNGCYTLTVFDSTGDGLGRGGGFVVAFDGVEQSRARSFGRQVEVELGQGCT